MKNRILEKPAWPAWRRSWHRARGASDEREVGRVAGNSLLSPKRGFSEILYVAPIYVARKRVSQRCQWPLLERKAAAGTLRGGLRRESSDQPRPLKRWTNMDIPDSGSRARSVAFHVVSGYVESSQRVSSSYVEELRSLPGATKRVSVFFFFFRAT